MSAGDDAAAQTLRRLLDDGAQFDAEFGGGLSNHLPMALGALHRLGADAARLQAFAEAYTRRLAPAPGAQPWPAGDAWAARLGERAAWPAYRDLFAQWLQFDDAGDVLRSVLPVLMVGAGAAAFHGLIRTAYAVQAARRQELADALAYWACRWAPLLPDDDGAAGHETDPRVVLRSLPALATTVVGGRIVARMRAAAALPGFADSVNRLQVRDDTLEQLARGGAALYAASGNFTVLHLLTSAHALRVLLPWLEDPQPALRAYWRAWAAGWAASDARDSGLAPLRTWDAIVDHARASDDDHVAKLVDSCREQEQAYGGGVWRRAASRVLNPTPAH